MNNGKGSRSGKKGKSEKIHFEIAPGNLRRLEDYLNRYNLSPERMTPKLKVADVVNEALVEFIRSHGTGLNLG